LALSGLFPFLDSETCFNAFRCVFPFLSFLFPEFSPRNQTAKTNLHIWSCICAGWVVPARPILWPLKTRADLPFKNPNLMVSRDVVSVVGSVFPPDTPLFFPFAARPLRTVLHRLVRAEFAHSCRTFCFPGALECAEIGPTFLDWNVRTLHPPTTTGG